MTDWLDVEEVRAAMASNEIGLRGDKQIAHKVLEAIAALPEPEKCFDPIMNPGCEHERLHRIWLVAREVVGT